MLCHRTLNGEKAGKSQPRKGSASELPTRTEKESGAQARDGEPFTAPLIPLPVAMLASAPGLSRSFLKLWTPASARAAAQLQRPPLPPFSREDAIKKVRMAENAWNTRDPETVSLAYTEDCVWRNRDAFFQGREAIVKFLRQKWEKEQEYRLIKELFAFEGNRIGVCFQYEFKDASTGIWYRAYGNENWDFAANGLMCRRQASINDVQIKESDRRFTWPELGKRPEARGDARRSFIACWVVEHRAVLIRSQPSVKAEKLGIVCKGHVLKGYEMEGWVKLTRESSIQAGVADGKVAWVLIDGQEVGLGLLLRPLKPGEKPRNDKDPREESDDEKHGVAWRSEDIYTGALEFEVLFKSVSVRRRPRVTSKSLGIVTEGNRLWGYAKENWLQTNRKYRQKEQGWIRIDGTDLGHGQLLQCTMMKPATLKCFAEALLINWQPLPAKSVVYTLEWMAQDKKKINVAVEKTRLCVGKIGALAADSTFYVRVTAHILIPGVDANDPKSVCAKVSSDWVEAQTGSAVDETEEAAMTFDPLAKIRGKCGDCQHCANFILSKYSYLMRLDEVLCRRCGCACTSHEIVGEYGKSRAQWAKDNERRQREGQRRQQQVSKPKPIMPAELPCVPWQPDDAPVGKSKARYVIEQVKKARNLYETLGVRSSAAAKDIRNAYRQIALRIHPDKVTSGGKEEEDLVAQAEAAFKLVSSAYEVLGDEGKRSSYNHTAKRCPKITGIQKSDSPAVLILPHADAHTSKGQRKGCSSVSKAIRAKDHSSCIPESFLVREFRGVVVDLPALNALSLQGAGTSKAEVVLTAGVQVNILHSPNIDINRDRLGFKLKVSHAVHGEEIRMSMNRGSVMGLKRALCKKVKRGPPKCIDICDSSGCILGDDHRFADNQELHCIGISLGPPKTIKVEVKDHRSGARMQVEVLDTSSMETVRKKVARELKVKEKELQIGQQKTAGKYSSRRFEALPSEELLNGRRMLYIHGNGVLIYFSLEQGLQLQRELIVAYGECALLSEYPMPRTQNGVGDLKQDESKISEAFGKLVRDAQKATLARWGFEGDFAAQNMMTAFGKVAHTPEVYELSLEIDKLLRITSGVFRALDACAAMDGELLYMENEHYSLVDALPYIDTQLGAAEVAQQVKALIEEEMTQFEPRDYLASLPAPTLTVLSSEQMQQEFARVSRRAPLGAVDPKKYEVEKPDGEAAEDENSWKSVSATTQINLEYARIKSVNLELLEQWGKKAWIAHNMLIRGAERVLNNEATELRASREEVNKKRKLDQISCGNDLRKLTREFEQYQQDNGDVDRAVRDLELDIMRLREAAAERGVDISDVDPLAKPQERGMIAAPVKPKKDAQAKAVASASDSKEKSEKPKNSKVPSKSGPKPPVVITVRQAVEEDNEPPAPALKVAVPADATMRRLKQAIAEKLGLKRTASLKLVFHLDSRLRKTNMPESGMTFASFKDDELIGSRREVLLLGADLRDVAEVRVELSGVPQLPDGTVVVFVSQSATLREVKEAAARKLLGKEAEEPTAARIAEAVRQPGTDKSQQVEPAFTRERLSYELAYKTDEQKALAISDLAAKGEAVVVSHLDYIVSELQRSPGKEMKQAICKAVIAAGPAAAAFYHEIANLISDNNPEVRYWGCLAVGTMGSSASGAKRQIRSLLQDSSEAVRFGACSALGGMKAEDCMEDLKEKLADPSPEVQGAACLALGRMGVAGTKYADMIVPKLSEPRSRSDALKALALMGPEGSKYCEKVVECLCDEDAETRTLAASVVGKMSDYVKDTPAAMNRILDLAKDEDGRKRLAAVLALGYMGRDAASHKGLLQDCLMDEFEEDAENALTQGGCRARLPPSCRKAKCAAAAALARIASQEQGYGWESTAADVARLLSSDDWEVRLCALECLTALGRRARESTDKVVGQLSDEKYIIRAKAATALSRIGELESIGLNKLSDLLKDTCPAVKSAAALALAELGDDGAEYCNKVFDLLTDISADVRAAAVTALSKMSDKGRYFTTVIAQRLKTEGEDPKVRVAAMEALSALEERSMNFLDLIKQHQRDEVPSVREAANKCLGRLGQGGYGAIQDNGDEVTSAGMMAGTIGDSIALDLLQQVTMATIFRTVSQTGSLFLTAPSWLQGIHWLSAALAQDLVPKASEITILEQAEQQGCEEHEGLAENAEITEDVEAKVHARTSQCDAQTRQNQF
ncbi:bcas2 [Symbiodinium sp. KB8]|nr:bcas2 [Symbiodinium sp. KB8]